MRRIIVWGLVALGLGLFWMWHAPRGGPLTAEDFAEFERLGSFEPSQDGFAPDPFVDFFLEDDGRPFFMVNLIKSREAPVYPEGFDDPQVSVDDAARAYAFTVLRLLAERGSYIVFTGELHGTLLNSLADGADDFDSVAIVRYRSRRDFLDMATSPDFQAAVPHKWASVEKTLVTPVAAPGPLSPATWIPFAILAIGLTFAGRRPRGNGAP